MIRKKIESNEDKILINSACHSSKTRGRDVYEPEDEIRTCFIVR